MKKILWMIVLFFPFVLSGCGSDDELSDIGNESDQNSIIGKKYEGSDSHITNYGFMFSDYEAQDMAKAVRLVPKDKYTASWTHNDTLLTTNEQTTKRISLSFDSESKATLVDYTHKKIKQQSAKVYHDYYRFKEDYHVENGLYMLDVSKNAFIVYDKTIDRRYAFELDGNYGCEITFYQKYGGEKESSSSQTEKYYYSYKYDKESSRFYFSDDKGHSSYGYVYDMYNTGGSESVFSLHLDDYVYKLEEQ